MLVGGAGKPPLEGSGLRAIYLFYNDIFQPDILPDI